MRKIVTDHIISPDGEFMWTGSKWIPASTPATETTSSAGMSLQDSAIEGSINITQNNAEDIATAMVSALERLGFTPSKSRPVPDVADRYDTVCLAPTS